MINRHVCAQMPNNDLAFEMSPFIYRFRKLKKNSEPKKKYSCTDNIHIDLSKITLFSMDKPKIEIISI